MRPLAAFAFALQQLGGDGLRYLIRELLKLFQTKRFIGLEESTGEQNSDPEKLNSADWTLDG